MCWLAFLRVGLRRERKTDLLGMVVMLGERVMVFLTLVVLVLCLG